MGSRDNLQTLLEAVLGTRNVYFQPPASLKIKYPAIIYEFERMKVDKADNIPYKKGKCYSVTLIHDDPDNEVVDELLNIPYSSLDRTFKTDNLYHYVFEIFY